MNKADGAKRQPRFPHFWPLAILLSIAAALYLPALGGGFVWDDLILFGEQARLSAEPLNWQNISQPVIDGTGYFRPLALFSFALDLSVSENPAALMHLINLLLHLINITLVYLLATGFVDERQTLRWLRPLAASLIYAVHPALIEPVVWISGRFDLLATTFVLAALACDARMNSSAAKPVVTSLLFLLALCSKETGVLLLPLIILLRLAREQDSGVRVTLKTMFVRDRMLLIGFGLVAVACLAAKALSQNQMGVGIRADEVSGLEGSLALVLQAIALYTHLALLPFTEVSPFHPLNAGTLTLSSPDSLIGIACLAGFTGLLWLLRKQKAAFWLFVAAMLALAPALQIIRLMIGDNIGHDRYLTLPLAFVCCALALVRIAPQHATPSRPRALNPTALGVAILLAWVIPAVIVVAATVPRWKDQPSLWAWVYQKHPGFPEAQFAYLGALVTDKLNGDALAVARAAQSDGQPLSGDASVIVAEVLLKQGQSGEAETVLLDVLPRSKTPAASGGGAQEARKPEMIKRGYAMLASIALNRGKFDQSLEYCELAGLFYDGDPYLKLQKSFALMGLGQSVRAKQMAEAARDMATTVELKTRIENDRQRFTQFFCQQPRFSASDVCRRP